MVRVFLLSILLFSWPAAAEHPHADGNAHDHPPAVDVAAGSGAAPTPEAHRAVIVIRGMVCSFCAHGVDKALSALPVLDDSAFGNGVLIDIESQRVTLAFQPGQVIPFSEIHKRIRKAGYDPVRFHLNLEGELRQTDAGWTLQSGEQMFALADGDGGREPGPRRLRAHVEADAVKDLEPGAPVPVVFDAWL